MANLVFSIIFPIFILNKGPHYLSPTHTLLLALCFPIGYGLYDYLKNHHRNYVSLLGVLNVLITGGFAIAGFSGVYFAIKEASFPLLIGLFVLASAYTKTPFVRILILNKKLFKTELLEKALLEKNLTLIFDQHVKTSTILLSFSFFLSSLLNFGLARHFFTPIAEQLSEESRAEILNTQIAQMTTWSYPVILVPSLVALSLVLWHLFSGIKKLTGLSLEELAHEDPKRARQNP